MTEVLKGCVLVAAGGALGAAARYLTGIWTFALLGASFPWATFFVNISGSFLMGFLMMLMSLRFPLSHEVKLFLTTGVLGGFTTFSAFAFDVSLLWQKDEIWAALFYVLGSVCLSILVLFIGASLARFAFQ